MAERNAASFNRAHVVFSAVWSYLHSSKVAGITEQSDLAIPAWIVLQVLAHFLNFISSNIPIKSLLLIEMLGTCQGFCGTRNYKTFRLVASWLTYPESTYACKAKCIFCLSPALFFCHALFPLLMWSSVVISLTLYKNALQQRCSCYPAQEQTFWEYKRFMMVQFISIWLRLS